jgi:hypothetical protein
MGAVLGAGLGGWVGGRWARGTQKRQHAFDLRKAIDEQGRKKAEEAVTALRFLQRHRDEVATWSTPSPPGDLSRTHQELDKLGQAVVFLTNDEVRSQVDLVHSVIADCWVVDRFGDHEYPNQEALIWTACREGLDTLGRYLRNEQAQPPTEHLRKLRAAYDSGYEELARQHAEWEEKEKQKEASDPD